MGQPVLPVSPQDRKDALVIVINRTVVFALVGLIVPLARGDQGSLPNSGGTTAVGSAVIVSSSTAAPAGALNLNCPVSGTGRCAGGSLSYTSNDGATTVNASFTSGTYAESCAGGGKGGNITCGYSFTGYFSGVLAVNGLAQAIIGVTSQAFGTGGAAAHGITAYNSAYTPFYYSDSEQIHRADDLQGTNQISFGSQGSGVGQFYGAYGIALDASGRIYVADTYNCRIVRIDDMNGTNWTAYGGTCGSGQGQFSDPSGIAVDLKGRIYVLDTGNSRLVRMDNMSGANWIAYGSAGSGVGQFAPYLQSLALDAAGRIYVADTGNKRLVRVDDMTGTNWTVLTQSQPVNGAIYSLQSPAAVAFDPAGRIYIADNEYYQPAVVRVDDMTGSNWTSIYAGSGSGLNSISVDSSGTVYAGGGGARIVVNMAAVLTSSGTIGPIGSYYVFGVTPVPLPSPRPSAISFSPPSLAFTQNVGGTSPAQTLAISNFGGTALDLGTISASGGFVASSNCPNRLPAGSLCTVSATFTPSLAGAVSGLLNVTDDSGNLGSAQTVALSGVGTVPAASLSPGSLTFSSQVIGTTSSARSVTFEDTGTGPLQLTGITVNAPFSQTNNCTAILAPGASCTIQISFTPNALGAASGVLTLADNAGTQTVSLTGTGTAPVSLSASSLNLGTVAVGSTSASRSVSLTNHQKISLAITSVTASVGFAIGGNTCGTSVAAGASCSVAVTFSPVAIGTAAGTLTFIDSAANSPQVVSLSGTGSAPVTLSTSALSFGTVTVGSTSSTRTVTLTNRASAPLNFSSILASAGFNIANNTCGAGIAAGSSCSIGITFSPSAAGAVAGTLTFTDNAANSPQVVSLTGTGR